MKLHGIKLKFWIWKKKTHETLHFIPTDLSLAGDFATTTAAVTAASAAVTAIGLA